MTDAKTRIAVLGGRGMLGNDLMAALARSGYAAVAWDLPEFDITQTAHLEMALSDADAVINCAAFTNVELAEEQAARAYAVNAQAVGELGRLAKARNIPVLHISTDFVFDGEADRPYGEDDLPKPVNVYGASKLAGERALLESGCAHLILRVQWSYGVHGTNFIKKIIERAQGNKSLMIVADQVGAPTWTRDMSSAIVELLRKEARGLLHFANSGYASRYEVACFVLNRLGFKNPVQPCRSNEFPSRVRRPLNSRFDLTRISKTLDRSIRTWQEALEEFLQTQHLPAAHA